MYFSQYEILKGMIYGNMILPNHLYSRDITACAIYIASYIYGIKLFISFCDDGVKSKHIAINVLRPAQNVHYFTEYILRL